MAIVFFYARPVVQVQRHAKQRTPSCACRITDATNNKLLDLMRTQVLVPLSLTDEFAMHEQKNPQWSGFQRKNALQPMKLVAVIEALREYLLPVLSALAAGCGYNRRWRAGVVWDAA